MQIENERNTQFLQAKNNRKRAEQIKDELKESEETIQKIRGTISSIQEEIAKLTGNREIAEKQISDDIKSACNLITCNQSTLTGDTDVNTLQTIKNADGSQVLSIEDFDAKPYHVQSVITMLQRAADEKKAELSKNRKTNEKDCIRKKIPLDETEIKTLADQINVAEQELVRLQTEYANEEKNLNELKEQVKDVTKEGVQTQINEFTLKKRNLEENREKTREAYHNYEKNRETEKGIIQMLLRQIEETEKAISFPEEEIEKQAGELRAKEMRWKKTGLQNIHLIVLIGKSVKMSTKNKKISHRLNKVCLDEISFRYGKWNVKR